jgi:hypothetical protein
LFVKESLLPGEVLLLLPLPLPLLLLLPLLPLPLLLLLLLFLLHLLSFVAHSLTVTFLALLAYSLAKMWPVEQSLVLVQQSLCLTQSRPPPLLQFLSVQAGRSSIPVQLAALRSPLLGPWLVVLLVRNLMNLLTDPLLGRLCYGFPHAQRFVFG